MSWLQSSSYTDSSRQTKVIPQNFVSKVIATVCQRVIILFLFAHVSLAHNVTYCYRVIVLLSSLYVFYTIPLTLATNAANPTNYEEIWIIFPGLEDFKKENETFFTMLSGIIPALIWTLFFATW